MAENDDLAKVVLEHTGKVLIEENPTFKSLCGGEIGPAASVLHSIAGIIEDNEWTFKILSGSFIGQGYDFTKRDEKNERPAKETYQNNLKSIQELAESMPRSVGRIVKSGVVEGKFGWYVTKFPGE